MKKCFICILTAGLLALVGCRGPRHDFIRFSGPAQGGTYVVTADLMDSPGRRVKASPEQIQSGVDSILHEIDFALSGYNPASELSRYNRGEAVSPGPHFLKMLSFADGVRIRTDGAVDAFSAALFDLWGFGFKQGTFPSEAEVAAARQDRSRCNFNAFAQGYSADCVASYLRGLGIRNLLVNVGGEIFCAGQSPRGAAWRWVIDWPADGNEVPGGDIEASFDVPPGPCAVVTSGNYRKFFIHEGRKYAHTIDPRSGYPVSDSLRSVTVILRGDDPMLTARCDARATWCMVLGLDGTRELARRDTSLHAILIYGTPADTLATDYLNF